MSDDTSNKIFEITKKIVPEELRSDFSMNSHLFNESILDSFGLIELVGELDTAFSVSIKNEDLTIENFSTIEDITKLVNSYKG